MNRTFKLALAAVLGIGLVMPAMAQDQFPDVPLGHWAYEALEVLRAEGILVGYPDGNYRGQRPLTRYELAVALYAAYSKLQGSVDGLDDRITEIEDWIEGNSGTGGASKAELAELKAALDALKKQVDGMAAWGPSIDRLQKMAAEFEKDLAALGVDVEALKSGLNSLEERVAALEARKLPVDISGDVNLLALAGHSSDGQYGLLRRGTLVGNGPDTDGAGVRPSGMTRDLTVLHEAALKLKGTNEEGPQWAATFIVGNLFPSLGSYSETFNTGFLGGFGGGDKTASTDIFIDQLEVNFNSAVLGQGFSAKVGRVGLQVGDYLLKRPNPNFEIYQNDRYADGNYRVDGGLLSFGFGAATLNVFGGKTSGLETVNGNELNPMTVSAGAPFAQIDQMLGVSLAFPIAKVGDINLAYMFQDMNTEVGAGNNAVNRLNVFGGELNLGFGALGVSGKFSQANASYNTSNVNDEDNTAWDLSATYNGGKFALGAGYREIEPNFAAFGDWGRIGTLWNPTNVKGFNANVAFMPNDALTLKLRGEFLQPQDEDFNIAMGTPLLDEVSTYGVDVHYNLSDAWKLMLGYEHVDWKWDVNGVDDSKQSWFTVGFDYKLSPAANLMFTYIFNDTDSDDVALPVGVNAFTRGNIAPGSYKGGLLASQLSIKF